MKPDDLQLVAIRPTPLSQTNVPFLTPQAKGTSLPVIHEVLTGDSGRWVEEDKEDVKDKKRETRSYKYGENFH